MVSDSRSCINLKHGDLPNVNSFAFQIYRLIKAARSGFAEISSRASSIDLSPIEVADTEYTWSELKGHLNNAINFFEQHAKPEDFAGQEGKEIVLYDGAFRFLPQQYLQSAVIPDFFFHVTTAYDLLRSAGVPLSKVDYIFGSAGVSR